MAETTTRHRDVVELLEAQHRSIVDLFDFVRDTKGPDRSNGLHHLLRLLAAHEIAEEEVVHPIIGRLRRGVDVANARVEEEHRIKPDVERLERLDPDGTEFDERLEALRTLVLAHMAAEETDEFPLVRSQLDSRERRSMLERVRLAEGFAPVLARPPKNSGAAGWADGRVSGADVVLAPFREMAETIRDALRVEDERRAGKR